MLKIKPFTVGLDEVGRGALAGPVVAGAVLLNLKEETLIQEIKDSKLLSRKKREHLAKMICRCAISWAIGSASIKEIHRLNILGASLLAMRRAYQRIGKETKWIHVDGIHDPWKAFEVPSSVICIPGGDRTCPSIGAASIIAKVYRDRYMSRMARYFPEYMFEQHVGYPTKLHRAAILKYGPTRIHRLGFQLLAKSID